MTDQPPTDHPDHDQRPPWQQVGRTVAEGYHQHLVPAMFAPWAPSLVALAAVRRGECVLDVACGTGVVTRLAATRVGSAGRVVGLDLNEAMLAVARSLPAAEEGASIEWIEANALDIPLAEAVVDVVLCQQGLQQLSDRSVALREMRRVLVPDGRLALSVWSRIEDNPGMAALATALERHVGVAAATNRRAPFALGDAAHLRGLVANAGFRDVQVRRLVKTARFLSPDDLVHSQLAATPLVTLGALTAATRWAVVEDVRAALETYRDGGALAVPMTAHVVLARA